MLAGTGTNAASKPPTSATNAMAGMSRKMRRMQAMQEREESQRAIHASSTYLNMRARLNSDEDITRWICLMVNPEAAEPRGFPDSFSKKSFVWKAHMNIDTHINDDGSFLICARPYLYSPLLIKERTTGHRFTGTVVKQTDNEGLFDKFSAAGESQDLGYMRVTATDSNIVVRMYDASDNFWFSPTKGVLNGTNYYGYPGISGSTGFQVSCVFGQNIPGTSSVVLTGVTQFGNVVLQTVVGNGTNVVTFNPGSTGAGPSDNIGTGLQLKITGGQSDVLLISVNIDYTAPLPYQHWGAYQYPSWTIQQQETVVTHWRVVGMAMLVTFQGSEMEDGGKITSAYFKGGDDPSMAGLYDYDTIAAYPGAFEGPSRTGTFLWWSPSQISDMDFKNNVTSQPYNLPCLICSGVLEFPDTVVVQGVIRTRLVTIYEGMGLEQMMGLQDSPVCPEEVIFGMQASQDFPHAMENALHWSDIAKFFKKVAHGATAAIEVAGKVAPVLAAGAALL